MAKIIDELQWQLTIVRHQSGSKWLKAENLPNRIFHHRRAQIEKSLVIILN